MTPVDGYVEIDPDTLMNRDTWRAALRAAGAAIAATDAVIGAAMRMRSAACARLATMAARAMGFCFQQRRDRRAARARRTVWSACDHRFDVHHGNGTEAAFANDERVLMCSFFQHPLYPFSGADQAPNMVNLPMPARSNGMAIREAVDMFWLPRLDAFKPQMLFVSAGFDAHREDDIGNLGLVEADFEWLTAQIVDVARRMRRAAS